MKHLVGLVAVLALLGGAAVAQSAEADIWARLKDKTLLIKGFWAEDELEYDATGIPLRAYRSGPFTLAGFDAKKVRVSGDHLRIEGLRIGLVFDKDPAGTRLRLAKTSGFTHSPEKITIEIDGHGDTDFGTELDTIFATSLADITPALPKYWQIYAKEHFLMQVPPTDNASQSRKAGASVTSPEIIFQPKAAYSDAGRQQKLSGDVLVDLLVTETGMPENIVITKALGLGMDEQAVSVVSQYRFAPALKNGKAIKVQVTIKVNFQIR